MNTYFKNSNRFLIAFFLFLLILPAICGLTVRGYQTKVADVTIDFTWIELAKDGDIDWP